LRYDVLRGASARLGGHPDVELRSRWFKPYLGVFLAESGFELAYEMCPSDLGLDLEGLRRRARAKDLCP
jgi:hypothetical protein